MRLPKLKGPNKMLALPPKVRLFSSVPEQCPRCFPAISVQSTILSRIKKWAPIFVRKLDARFSISARHISRFGVDVQSATEMRKPHPSITETCSSSTAPPESNELYLQKPLYLRTINPFENLWFANPFPWIAKRFAKRLHVRLSRV